MKKGFTLVEIIISVTLILIVGASATFFVLKKNNNKELETITKEILEAANAYIKIEKDKNGNIYANEIISGRKGVQIPLSNLVNSGYIKEEAANKIYDNYKDSEKKLNDKNTQDYYVLFVQEIGGSENEDYCNANEITSFASWMPKNENIYLCNSYKTPHPEGHEDDNTNFTKYLLNLYGGESNIKLLNTITADSYETSDIMTRNAYNQDGSGKTEPHSYVVYSSVKDNGVFKRTENGENLFYYRGNINDNYVKFKTGTTPFQIISFTEEKITIMQPFLSYSYQIINTNNLCDSFEGPFQSFMHLNTNYNASLLKNASYILNSECDKDSKYVRLITANEASFAGIDTKTEYIVSCNYGCGYFSLNYNNQYKPTHYQLFINNSWLANTESTITDGFGIVYNYTEYQTIDGFSELQALYGGKGWYGSAFCSGEKCTGPVSFVMEIKNSSIKYLNEGNGTKQAPYIIDFK